MMPKILNDIITLRVTSEMKAKWEQQALDDHRTMTSWIIHRVESYEPVAPDSMKRPRRRSKAMVG